MDFSFDMLLMAFVMVITNGVTIKWLKSDQVKHEAIHKEDMDKVEKNIVELRKGVNTLYERTTDVMRRHDVEEVVRHEVAPLRGDITSLTSMLDSLSKTMVSLDKSMAILVDRENRKGINKTLDILNSKTR